MEDSRERVDLESLVSAERVFFADPRDKQEALGALIDASLTSPLVADAEGFRADVLRRESILSTGIGQNIAVPHVRSPHVSGFFVTVGIFRNGVDWDSLDGQPVRLAFLIAGPQQHEAYLQILSGLTLIIRKREAREAIIAAPDAQTVVRLLSSS